jgi:spore germination cell wall hydrolase CwlJ-like protein
VATLVKTESVLNIITTMAVASTFALAGCVTAEGKIVVNATTQDHKCLAQAIYYESGSEPRAGKIAVGHVILNRVNSGIYPTTICKVINHVDSNKCQFGWACRAHKKPVGKRWETSQEIATLILSGETRDLSRGALSFRNIKNKIRNKQTVEKTATIGHHVFWRPKQLKADNRQGEIK